MTSRTDQIKALASENRMQILRLLMAPGTEFSHQESADPETVGVCMNLIAERLGVSQPTVSRHIELLRRAGFLTVRKQQKWSYCARDEDALREYHGWLAGSLGIEEAS
ncbi:ArsR/SmtB family transcription factor [Roseibium sp. Sym1]|uniref:ArsR/SmtB family transcription factor n=1 Tax=Roseibium sp. Sym1 TaxID=3016006 RepID=UPI0022B35101|nr:metalloregulator ArsR/SmtB family transcription factor [Roseibium sp. Sym1]